MAAGTVAERVRGSFGETTAGVAAHAARVAGRGLIGGAARVGGMGKGELERGYWMTAGAFAAVGASVERAAVIGVHERDETVVFGSVCLAAVVAGTAVGVVVVGGCHLSSLVLGLLVSAPFCSS